MPLSILKGLRSTLLERASLKDLPDLVRKRTAILNTWGTNPIEGSTIGWKNNPSALKDLLKVRMASSLLDLLDQVGTSADVLISLKVASEISPYNEKYLALRCNQGKLPALREGREWRTSPRALELYVSSLGRK